MMTQRRFKALAQSYGADLRRWPAETQAGAKMLIAESVEARAILASARELDEALESIHCAEEASFGSSHESEAALARLRCMVDARIAAPAADPPRRWTNPGWASPAGLAGVLHAPLGLLGLAASGGLAVAIGLMIGLMPDATGASDPVMALLQAAPIHLLPL